MEMMDNARLKFMAIMSIAIGVVGLASCAIYTGAFIDQHDPSEYAKILRQVNLLAQIAVVLFLPGFIFCFAYALRDWIRCLNKRSIFANFFFLLIVMGFSWLYGLYLMSRDKKVQQ